MDGTAGHAAGPAVAGRRGPCGVYPGLISSGRLRLRSRAWFHLVRTGTARRPADGPTRQRDHIPPTGAVCCLAPIGMLAQLLFCFDTYWDS